MRRSLAVVCGILGVCVPLIACAEGEFGRVRVATFNLHDVKEESIEGDAERLSRLGDVIRAIDADIILLNEIADGVVDRFVARFVLDKDGPKYRVFQAPSNTGVHSGFDLDNNGTVTEKVGSRAYGGDCWGYGEFPGQYGMALLVRDGLEIMRDDVRTFREFLWKDMPQALLPPLIEEEGGAVVEGGWYSDEERAGFRLSSKSHWDVPVRLPNGDVLHVLCSHPTPPVFDGIEDRNGRRNHDEIRFWHEYLEGAEWIVDDSGTAGGLDRGAEFVIVGDLNADPDEGDGFGNPIKMWLLNHPRVNETVVPTSVVPMTTRRGELDPDDTAMFGLRADYVLVSDRLSVVGSGVVRGAADLVGRRGKPGDGEEGAAAGDDWAAWGRFPSDHFPVWVDVVPSGGHGSMGGKGDGGDGVE